MYYDTPIADLVEEVFDEFGSLHPKVLGVLPLLLERTAHLRSGGYLSDCAIQGAPDPIIVIDGYVVAGNVFFDTCLSRQPGDENPQSVFKQSMN